MRTNGHRSFVQGVKTFGASRRGATAIIFGLALIPIMLMIGVGVDYSRATSVRTRLQNAVDSGALAAAAAQAQGNNPTAAANIFLQQQLVGIGAPHNVVVTPNSAAGTVQVSAQLAAPTSIMQIVGVNSIGVSAQATATTSATGGGGATTEVVIAFDTTGSMSVNNKLVDAQAAATNFVNSVMYAQNSSVPNPNVKVGLVPFTDYVNIGTQYAGSSWLTSTASYTVTSPQSCYNSYPNAVYGAPTLVTQTCSADGVPYDCSYWNYPVVSQGSPQQVCYIPSTTYTWYGCVGSQNSPNDQHEAVSSSNQVPALLNYSCPSPLIQLSNDPTAVQSAVSAMSAGGETYIAPGLLWAWRVISPDPPFSNGAAYGTSNKIIILMTDGANTHSASYPDHENSDVPTANTMLATVCQNVKNAGITLYTIAFNVSDPTIMNVLSNCATGAPYYYNAQTNADLAAAYAQIAQQVNALRLVR
ncbi:MAG: TadE/TadG family type IV pilus assembly protein [Methylocystis sp.]